MRGRVAGLFVLALAVLATAAAAQQPGRTYRLGILFHNEPGLALIREVTLPELARQGFVEGNNLAIDVRIVPADQTTAAVADLVAAHPDVVITADFDAARLLMSASPRVAVVMSYISEDPVFEFLRQRDVHFYDVSEIEPEEDEEEDETIGGYGV